MENLEIKIKELEAKNKDLESKLIKYYNQGYTDGQIFIANYFVSKVTQAAEQIVGPNLTHKEQAEWNAKKS